VLSKSHVCSAVKRLWCLKPSLMNISKVHVHGENAASALGKPMALATAI
jgi:hypothetical protein